MTGRDPTAVELGGVPLGRAPFARWPEALRRRLLWISAGLSFVLMGVLTRIGVPLESEAAPRGIVSFELAGDASTAQAILDSWSDAARLHAALSLGLDYLFLVAYAVALSLACVEVAKRIAPTGLGLARVGVLLAWGQLLAAGLDAIENFALIQLLLGSDGASWPGLAWWCAAIKFGWVGAGLLYVIGGSIVVVVARRGRGAEGSPRRR